jgi:hypothetical protein
MIPEKPVVLFCPEAREKRHFENGPAVASSI